MPSSDLKLNCYYEITGFQGDSVVLERLSEMGFHKNKKIKISQNLPFNGPSIIEMDHAQISLRQEEIECLLLKPSP